MMERFFAVLSEVTYVFRKSSLLDMFLNRSKPVVRPLLKAKYAITKMEMQPVTENDQVNIKSLLDSLHL